MAAAAPFIVTLAAGLAGATILSTRFVANPRDPRGLMILLLLVVLLWELPVHLAGALELFGLAPSVSGGLLVSLAIAVLIGTVVVRRFYGVAGDRTSPPDAPGASVHGDQPAPIRLASGLKPSLRSCAVLVVLVLAVFLVELMTGFPAGWDARAYHLPTAVRWLQLETLSIPQALDWRYALPGNSEVLNTLMLGAGWDRLATAGNLIALVVLVCATWTISMRIGQGDAVVASCLITATLPIIIFQAFSGYVDLFGTAFLLAGLALFLERDTGLLSLHRRGSFLLTIGLAGCACGLAIGTKPIFWPYAALFLVVACAALTRPKGVGWGKPVAVLLFTVAIPSAFWFLRAWVTTGNPVFPIPVEVAGLQLFPGIDLESITAPDYDRQYVRSTAEWFVYPWTEFMSTGYAYNTGAGLGALWATFVPIGVLFGGWRAIKRRDPADRGLLWLLAAILFLSVVWWFGLRRLPRFGLPILCLACCATTPYLAELLKRGSTIFRVSFMGALCLTLGLASWVPVHELMGRIRTSTWARSQVYGYPSVVDEWPEGTVVWNRSTDPMNYPLSGSRLSNIVIPDQWTGSMRPEDAVERFAVDYIVGFEASTAPPTAAARLVFEGVAGGREWRVWDVRETEP